MTYERTDLTSGQHILHLLLTVFTFGLWIPVWIIRAAQGNKHLVSPACYRCGQPRDRHGADLKCLSPPLSGQRAQNTSDATPASLRDGTVPITVTKAD